jgi:hypothetical protein
VEPCSGFDNRLKYKTLAVRVRCVEKFLSKIAQRPPTIHAPEFLQRPIFVFYRKRGYFPGHECTMNAYNPGRILDACQRSCENKPIMKKSRVE